MRVSVNRSLEQEPERPHRDTVHRGVWADSALQAEKPDPESTVHPWFNADWSVPWSDLMMVMFVLFAVLFCYRAAERDIQERVELPPASASAGPGSLFDLSQTAARAADLDNIEVILQADRSVRLSLYGPLLFDLGKAELKSATRPFLAEVAQVIRRIPCEVEVIGHTDAFPISTPEYPTNWELSAARASRVVRYLIDVGGIDPARFTVIGHALYRPATPNTTLDQRARNRRVEIVLVPEPALHQPAAPDPVDLQPRPQSEKVSRP